MHIPGSQQCRGDVHALGSEGQTPALHSVNRQPAQSSQKLPSVDREHDPDSTLAAVRQLPAVQIGALTDRVRVPVSSQVVENPLQRDQIPYVVVPQLLPVVLREQLPVSVDALLPQEPPPHTRVVTVRLREPDSSHVESNPPQLDHEPVLVLPQLTPSVPRLHARVSVTVVASHAPLPQARVVTARVCVPVRSQVDENPPQVDQAPVVVLPQLTPSVVREQVPVSVVIELPQLPPEQSRPVRVRVRLPLSSQVESKPEHPDHAPVVVLPQLVSSVTRVQAPLSVRAESPQAPIAQTRSVIVRVLDPVSSQVPLKLLQEDHAPVEELPQLEPSVSLTQPSDSVRPTSAQAPAAQKRSVTDRERVPDSSQVPSYPPHPDHEPRSAIPQPSPSVSREHAPVSMRPTSPQAPALQVRSVTERALVPDSPQAPMKPPHVPHTPGVDAPHIVPSVERVQAPISTRGSSPHTPAAQTRCVTVRLRVPVSVQSSVKPPQDPQSAVVGIPQLSPAVVRMQASVSVRSAGIQLAAMHE